LAIIQKQKYVLKFAHHLSENGRAFGKMEDVMETMYWIKKDSHVENMEKFFMYQETKKS